MVVAGAPTTDADKTERLQRPGEIAGLHVVVNESPAAERDRPRVERGSAGPRSGRGWHHRLRMIAMFEAVEKSIQAGRGAREHDSIED